MKLTKYLRIFNQEDEEGSLVLLSTKKGSIISVTRPMLADIQTGAISEEERLMLDEHGFLTEGPDAEQKEILGFIDELNEISRTLAIKLVMNVDCNLACQYCF